VKQNTVAPASRASSQNRTHSSSESQIPQGDERDRATAYRALLPAILTAFAAALVLRLLYLWEYSFDPTWTLSILDQKYNADIARKLLESGPPEGPWFRPPGYPIFLAIVRAITGDGFWGVRIIQAIIGAASAALVAVLAGRVFPAPAAWIAGLAMAAYGPLIVSDAEVLSPVLVIFLNTLMLLAIIETRRTGALGWPLIAGLSAGLSTIVRPDVLPFLAAACVIFLLQRRWQPLAVFAMTAALTILPITLDNLLRGREPVLISTNGGVNFWIGNNPQADGLSVNLPEKTTWSGGWEDYREIAEAQSGTGQTHTSAASHFFRKGIASYRRQPGIMFRLLAAKFYYFGHGLEVLNSRDDYASGYYSHIAGALLWARGIYFPFGIVLPMALVSLLLCWRSIPQVNWFATYLFCYWVTISLFFVAGRFRLPVVPVCIVLIAGAAALLLAKRSARTWPLYLLPVLLLASNYRYAGIWQPGRPAQYHFMAGTALENSGKPDDAIPHLRKAVELDPNLGDAALFLADALRTKNDAAGAEAIYRNLLARDPNNSSILCWYGEVVSLQGRFGEARTLFQKSLAIHPKQFDANMNLGVLLLQEGDLATAREHLRTADAIRPHPAAKLILAKFAIEEGNLAEARRLYEEAIRIDPGNPRPHRALAALLSQLGDANGARAALAQASALE